MMNERIQELAEQADIKFSAHWQHQGIDTAVIIPSDLKKFAELIVRECAERLLNDAKLTDIQTTRCVASIREHFGVEE
jgi:hypothetical protein